MHSETKTAHKAGSAVCALPHTATRHPAPPCAPTFPAARTGCRGCAGQQGCPAQSPAPACSQLSPPRSGPGGPCSSRELGGRGGGGGGSQESGWVGKAGWEGRRENCCRCLTGGGKSATDAARNSGVGICESLYDACSSLHDADETQPLLLSHKLVSALSRRGELQHPAPSFEGPADPSRPHLLNARL
jgi:hypothetical protein